MLDGDLERIAARLDETGDYRVLRRLAPFRRVEVAGDAPTRLGMLVDVETTGLDTAMAEIIEIVVREETRAATRG